MSILIEPSYNGIIQTFISIIIISGIIFLGNKVNNFFFRKYNHVLFDLLIGFILFSQLIKIFSYLGFFKQFNFIFSYTFLILGIYNLKNFYNYIKNKKKFFLKSKIKIMIFFTLFLFFIISISPPSMADALDYHYGFPLYLLKFNQIPPVNLWLFGALAGNGEFINASALTLGTDNFGSLIQFTSLVMLLFFFEKEIKQQHKFNFLIIFIISSPTILQLLSGPKFLLLPQIATTVALYLLIKLKKIELIDFVFISILLMGATQFKLSFLLSGSIIGIYTFFKAFKINKIKVLLATLLLFSFFYIPTAVWNFSQIQNPNFYNIFYSVPTEMIKNLSTFRENNYYFPFNLLIPKSLGTISTVIGFQFLLLFFPFKKTRNFYVIIFITLGTTCLYYFFGMNISRIYYEFILWSSIIFVFINDKKVNYDFYTKLMLPQLFIVICASLYFTTFAISGIFSNKMRDNFMKNNSLHYEGIKWANDILPMNAKIVSDLRSVSLFSREFAPTDWLDYNAPKNLVNGYLNIIKEKKMNYIIFIGKLSKNNSFKNCLGDKYAESEKIKRSTRNPFNRNSTYIYSIYKLNYEKLPNCAKD